MMSRNISYLPFTHYELDTSEPQSSFTIAGNIALLGILDIVLEDAGDWRK